MCEQRRVCIPVRVTDVHTHPGLHQAPGSAHPGPPRTPQPGREGSPRRSCACNAGTWRVRACVPVCLSALRRVCAPHSVPVCPCVCVRPRVCPPPAPPRRCQSPGGRFDVAALARRAVALAVGPGAPCSASRRRPLLQPNFPGLGGRGGRRRHGGAPWSPASRDACPPAACRAPREPRERGGEKEEGGKEKSDEGKAVLII